jgi:hypothetical protein
MEQTSLLKQFPFKSQLTLKLLISYWEDRIKAGDVPFIADSLGKAIDLAAELKQPIEDLTLIEKHGELIKFLMTAVIPSAQTDQDLIAATIPFQFKSFFATRAFERTIDLNNLQDVAKVNIPGNAINIGKTIHACLMILNQFYGVQISFDKPILFTLTNPATGLEKVYKIEIGKQFFEIISNGNLEPIDPKIIKFLTEKVYDIDLWLQYIKPEKFEFRGFMIFRMVDVTEQEMISSMKYDLLEKDAVTKKDTFSVIQQKLRSIFNLPDVRLGLAFFDSNDNIVLNSSEDAECWKTLSGDRRTGVPCSSYTGSIYERTWSEKRYITIEDLDDYPFKTDVERSLLANGIKNILLAPLIEDGETIGLLELASSEPGKLNAVTATKVENALPMFTAAVKRVKEEMATEVRAIIQEECTNIHPSVQWRFIQAGTSLLNRRRQGEKAAMEEIIFKDVFPLFGLADVRNSSSERNRAIQEDLVENLLMVTNLLNQIHAKKSLPLLDEIVYKTEKHLELISNGLASGDESNVLEFLKREINPLLKLFNQEDELKELVADYENSLDPVSGVVYKRRKAFEDSLGMINKMIGNYVDEAQEAAQEMFPHYFEKYQTDGIEYTLYIGSSLVRDRTFDTFYLKNFRLWQLMMMCAIDRKMDRLKPELPSQLDITQLILVHDQPLSIRFRPDEKQFDVDGAYDIRYEIVKKRIDKALIKNTDQRLTQPGKIAIVFNQPRIEEEYRGYFEYLAAKNLIDPQVEHLELDELQGANGLRAMRITIRKDAKVPVSDSVLLQNIREALSLQ